MLKCVFDAQVQHLFLRSSIFFAVRLGLAFRGGVFEVLDVAVTRAPHLRECPPILAHPPPNDQTRRLVKLLVPRVVTGPFCEQRGQLGHASQFAPSSVIHPLPARWARDSWDLGAKGPGRKRIP